MFRGYLHDDDRYRPLLRRRLVPDRRPGRRDADGCYWFVGRADDVIKSAGHLIGPFEVENVLLEHPAVVEAGVIGVPDPVAGEVVKAFVSLADDVAPGDELVLDLIAHCRRRLGAGLAPRQHRVRPAPAQDQERQDHAPPAPRPRARTSGGRPVDPRGDAMIDTCTHSTRAAALHSVDGLRSEPEALI